ncbi:MAG: hypothetical protein JNK35_11150 [Phycisphaerae bacterium]|nr:hypothetical protein [Phycisphaerae bacterium]
MSSESSGAAFVSVSAWPESFGPAEVQRAIIESTGMDPVDAHHIAARQPPMIVATMTAVAAADAASVLRARGADARSVTRTELDRYSPPMLAKRLARQGDEREGVFLAEPWRPRLEPTRVIRLANVVLLVRGRVDQTTRTTRVDTDPQFGEYDGAGVEFSRTTETRGSTQEVLDVYERVGPPVRVTGKFDFAGILGAERGYSDRENMDRLAVRLGEMAREAEVDLGFGEFRAPARGAATRRVRFGAEGIGPAAGGVVKVTKDEMPTFDFYSAWKRVLRG